MFAKLHLESDGCFRLCRARSTISCRQAVNIGRLCLSAYREIGGVEIHRIIEQDGAIFCAMEFFPSLTQAQLEENRSWLQPRFIDPEGKLVLCIQSYIVRTRHQTVLIDTCVGNYKPRPPRAFWHMMNSDRYEKSLAAAGFNVRDIDFVMCTHLHSDHVGWNTKLADGRWVLSRKRPRPANWA